METQPCPKCNGPMDEDRLSVTGSDYIGYVSNKQTGMLRTVTTAQRARLPELRLYGNVFGSERVVV